MVLQRWILLRSTSRRVALASVATVFMSGSALLHAETNPRLVLRAVYGCILNQHEMLTNFHLYASDPKDRVLNADFRKAHQTSVDCSSNVRADLEGLGYAQAATEISSSQERLEKTVQYNADSIAQKGVPENAVVAEMVQHELALVAALSQAASGMLSGGKLKEVPEAKQARDLAVLIEYANARYIERTTQLYPRDDSAEPTIDDLATRFNAGINALRTSKRLTPELKKKVESVNTRFRFINGSLRNYNQNTVPFTVNRHTKSMVILLNEVASSLEGTK